MARAARCNPPRSVLRSPPQRTAISSAAYSNLPHCIRQSSHNVLQFFTLRTTILHIAYHNFPHSVQKFFTQHTAIFHTAYSNSSHGVQQFFTRRAANLHTAYSNSSHSVLQSSPQRTSISSAAYRNLRLQPSDGHPKPSDGHPKASDVHPKAANGDFSYYPDTFLLGSGKNQEGCPRGYGIYSTY